MKKTKKLPKPKLPKNLPNVRERFRRGKTDEERFSEAISSVPRITNETVSEHREEVLSSARKYIYPLQHSKHRVVRISVSLLVVVLVSFFVWCGLALYKFQDTSSFIYNVTRIVPFPIGKAGDKWVGYESYLFELRRNMHYYRTQQGADFSTKDGKTQLERLKKQAMDQVVKDAYVKQLAAQNNIQITSQAVDNQVELVRKQNRLGSNERVFKDVLSEFWGWDEADFERELKQQMLQQAVASKLDTKTHAKAHATLQQIKSGGDFGKLATENSDDLATKPTGGGYPEAVTIDDRNLPPIVTAEIFRLKPGQVSEIIDTGYSLEIIKVTEVADGSAKAAHIQFNIKDVNTYVKPLQSKKPSKQFIKT
jgi:parvulin-like peptidyl-prolyl isomerase